MPEDKGTAEPMLPKDQRAWHGIDKLNLKTREALMFGERLSHHQNQKINLIGGTEKEVKLPLHARLGTWLSAIDQENIHNQLALSISINTTQHTRAD